MIKTFGKNLRKLRKRRKISQQELSKELAITQGYLSKVESGMNELRLLDAIELSRLLKCSIDKLLRPAQD